MTAYIKLHQPKQFLGADDTVVLDWDNVKEVYVNPLHIEQITNSGVHLVSGKFIHTKETAKEILDKITTVL